MFLMLLRIQHFYYVIEARRSISLVFFVVEPDRTEEYYVVTQVRG